ncbi:MAG: glycerophosphodiester phosphodiesterase family protein [Gammaproteobacteria bacterium]|nr:glycerophosphodiester phosphodiesterase family protein [Gammaproteobacteria bacterium]
MQQPIFIAPVFIAHRGYSAAYPENTLVALDAARKAGAKYLEVDIQLSADHVPVLFHDRDLTRLCQQMGAIHEYTYSQLQAFNVTDSEKFSGKFDGNKITSLQNFIDFLKQYPELHAFIELKRLMIDTFGEELVLRTILPMFEGMNSQVSFISYNQAILKTIHESTEYKTGIVVDHWNERDENLSWEAEWLFCSYEGLPENNDELNIDATIAIFEVGNTGLAKHLLAKGIRYLETFRIKEMLEAFPGEKHNA